MGSDGDREELIKEGQSFPGNNQLKDPKLHNARAIAVLGMAIMALGWVFLFAERNNIYSSLIAILGMVIFISAYLYMIFRQRNLKRLTQDLQEKGDT